ncbi:hypothetical protein ACPC54_32720 [Kitasatospora sp. NPDC094028]
MTFQPPHTRAAIHRRHGTDRRPPNALGDLVRVAAELRPETPEVLSLAAAMLGIGSGTPVPHAARPTPTPTPTAPPSPARAAETPPPARGRGPGEDPAVRPAGDDPRPPRPVTAEPLPAVLLPPRSAPASVTALLDAERPPATGPPTPYGLGAELFRADHQRAIIAELAAVERPGTEVDVARLLDLLTTRRPIRDVPLATTRTTRAGLHLLLDTGPSMRPFLRDLRLLVDRARTVVGQDGVTTLRFSGAPSSVRSLTHGGPAHTYCPPRSPRAVLVATDLGVAAAATGTASGSRRAWSAFARTLHEVGCPLILLVPYPPDRRPAWSERRFASVTWDRATDVGRARRAADHAADLLRSPW